MKEQFEYRFYGFHGTPSRCHIRVLDDIDKPLVVICSQLANHPGTSVTNAAEFIAKDVINYLSQDCLALSLSIHRYIKNNKLSKILDDLITKLK